MPELTTLQWIILLICSFLVGFSKTTGMSLSAIVIPIMAETFPVREATGILCLGFFIASFHATWHYRHFVKWNYFLKLAPGALLGLSAGAIFIQYVNSESIKIVIGTILLTMLIFSIYQDKYINLFEKFRISKAFTLICGTLMGFVSIVSNTASPIMTIYLLTQKENKLELISTQLLFFFFVDLVKIPISIWINVITPESLQMNLFMLPMMILGGVLGIAFIKLITATQFRRLIRIMTFAGGMKLIFKPVFSLF